MACCMRYKDLAKNYMENAKERTAQSPWDSFLYGLVLTVAKNARWHADIIKALKREYPTVEVAREKCKRYYKPELQNYIGMTELEELANAHSPKNVLRSICFNSREFPLQERTKSGGVKTKFPPWNTLAYSMQEPQCNKEGVRDHFTFQQNKGPDMMLLEGGCEVPVIDVWILRKLLNPEPKQEAQFQRDQNRIKSSRKLYRLYRDFMIDEANECGEPVGKHHVACWFEERAKDEEREGKSPEQVRRETEKYLDALFAAVKEVAP